MNTITTLGQKAKSAEVMMRTMTEEKKNQALITIADALIAHGEEILAANAVDLKNAVDAGMAPGMQDRLRLSPERLDDIAEGMRQVAALPDPIGETIDSWTLENGMAIRRVRVPLGVVGIIYESRPNVTPDAFSLCFKSGNVSFLRGGSDCIHSNIAMVRVMRDTLEQLEINPDVLLLVEDTSRETVKEMMRANAYIDVLIPRGGAGLIRSVVETSTIPVIETGTGNCHIFVDETADIEMALDIITNAKTQRVGVCNAAESLLVHRAIADRFLPALAERLGETVELRGDEIACGIAPIMKRATDEDWGTEYLDYILSVKIVDSVAEAIEHTNRYHTGHSDAIITETSENADRFLNEIDSACVYVNASTRFTDGFMFGFGAEIGISTQKLHARGPMGLKELTSYKYQIRGTGQVRG